MKKNKIIHSLLLVDILNNDFRDIEEEALNTSIKLSLKSLEDKKSGFIESEDVIEPEFVNTLKIYNFIPMDRNNYIYLFTEKTTIEIVNGIMVKEKIYYKSSLEDVFN